MNVTEFINAILKVRLDDKHAAFNKALPVFTGEFLIERLCEFKYINGLIELKIIKIEFDEDLERFLNQNETVFGLKFYTILQI